MDCASGSLETFWMLLVPCQDKIINMLWSEKETSDKSNWAPGLSCQSSTADQQAILPRLALTLQKTRLAGETWPSMIDHHYQQNEPTYLI